MTPTALKPRMERAVKKAEKAERFAFGNETYTFQRKNIGLFRWKRRFPTKKGGEKG